MLANLENSTVAVGLEKAFSLQSQRRVMPKMIHTTIQLHSFHMLAGLCSKSFKLGFRITLINNFRCTSWLSKRQRNQREIANVHWLMEKAREFKRNTYFCFIEYPEAVDWMDHNKLWKILKEMEVQDHLTVLLRNLSVGQKATVRTEQEQLTGTSLGK